MVLSVEIYILKYFRVYNWNNDEDEPDKKILLTSNSVTEWVDILLPIKSHMRSAMVVAEGGPVWLPVLDSLGFTVGKVYYGGKKFEISNIYPEVSSWEPVVVLIGNLYTRRLTVGLVQVQFF